MIRNLVAAAAGLGVRIDPAADRETRVITVSPADGTRLVAAARRLSFSSIESTQVTRLLNSGHRAATLDIRDAAHLTQALTRLAAAVDREQRISRGQYVGPMSGSEAVKFARGTHRF